MKYLMVLLVVLCLNSNLFGQNSLYPIFRGGLWGYIDKSGKEMIKPQFLAANQFSEGRAAVRINGKYGYVNLQGRLVIPPRFDLGNSFVAGMARIFIDGKPFFIDTAGKIAFEHSFKSIEPFGFHTFAVAVTESGKYCLINRAGGIIADSIFTKIGELGSNGLLVVEGLDHLPYARDSGQVEKFETGVIDSAGRLVIPYGRYKRIGVFVNGYASAERFDQTYEEKNWENFDAIIDCKGNLKFTCPPKKYFLERMNGGFHDGLAIVAIAHESRENSKQPYPHYYKGAVDVKGEIVISDTSWSEMTSFSHNRSFVKFGEAWKMINTNGRQVGDSVFRNILFDGFNENLEQLFWGGISYVEIASGWVAIDTNGNVLCEPIVCLNNFHNHLTRSRDLIFFDEDISTQNVDYSFLYGFWNSTNGKLVRPSFHYISRSFTEDITIAIVKGRLCYITSSGDIVWKEKKSRKRERNLNIDWMNRGYFYAASAYKQELQGLGGWGHSNNSSRKSSSEVAGPKVVQVVIDTKRKAQWQGYAGMQIEVRNYSDDTAYFDAQDSRLYLKIQAQKANGEWADIEYLPSSWCGNSYHQLFLASGEFWQFSAPIYHGEMQTKLRAQLLFKNSLGQDVDNAIYSNEVEGSVNPGQFWNKHAYSRRSFMDPYND
ncbi:MAG: WG repeat-containing protein [Taibaiella sp.]|nr:WG repeat-containing protein [Taibaiella sp.]